MRLTACLQVLPLLLLTACATTSLVPGSARLDDVEREMGSAALRWRDADGSQQLAYPRGPMGFATYMAHVAPDGTLLRIENVLDSKHFAQVVPGMDQAQVLRVLGPPQPHWTVYFAARDELAWEWRYCDAWNAAARFDVLFDATRGTVRSTLSLRENCLQADCSCAH